MYIIKIIQGGETSSEAAPKKVGKINMLSLFDAVFVVYFFDNLFFSRFSGTQKLCNYSFVCFWDAFR